MLESLLPLLRSKRYGKHNTSTRQGRWWVISMIAKSRPTRARVARRRSRGTDHGPRRAGSSLARHCLHGWRQAKPKVGCRVYVTPASCGPCDVPRQQQHCACRLPGKRPPPWHIARRLPSGVIHLLFWSGQDVCSTKRASRLCRRFHGPATFCGNPPLDTNATYSQYV